MDSEPLPLNGAYAPGVDPDDRLLRYFLVVAEELNFTRAPSVCTSRNHR
jgi:hypothetical protein